MTLRQDLAGKVIAVTGASRGLGRAFARRLVEEGAHVIILARASEALDKVAAELPDALAQPCDISSPESVRASFAAIRARFGKLDALVNNAVLTRPSRLEDISDEQLAREITTNFMGPALTIREALSLLRAAGGGDIVNVSSDAVGLATPHLTMYAANKAGLEQMSVGLREELRGEGIRVAVLRIGPVAETEMHRGWPMEERKPYFDELAASGAMARFGLPMRPEVIAETLVSLLQTPAGVMIDHLTLRPI